MCNVVPSLLTSSIKPIICLSICVTLDVMLHVSGNAYWYLLISED